MVLLSTSLSVTAQESLKIDLLFHWQDTSLDASFAHGNTYSEIWGYSRAGREYAIIGTVEGTHVFDVTTPTASNEVAYLPGRVQGPIIVHRDYHDYDDYLYMVSDEGPSSLQIADLRFLPDSMPIRYDSDSLFSRSHNIFIENGRMYVCGGDGQLSVYSLANPIEPILLVNCQMDVPFWSAEVGYVHDIFVHNDTAYCNAGNKGLFVIDFTDAINPVVVSSLVEYAQKGYNHSGWLDPARDLYAMADENHGLDIKLVDMSQLDDPEIVSFIGPGVHDSLSIAHNLIIKDRYLFVSHYYDGLYIWDIADPDNPYILGYYGTSDIEHRQAFEGAWGVYPFLESGVVLVSDMQNGLFVFDVSDALGIRNPAADEKKLTVFPNPFSSKIQLKGLPLWSDAVDFELFDGLGRLLKRGTLPAGENRIDIQEATDPGIYWLKLNRQGVIETHQLVKLND